MNIPSNRAKLILGACSFLLASSVIAELKVIDLYFQTFVRPHNAALTPDISIAFRIVHSVFIGLILGSSTLIFLSLQCLKKTVLHGFPGKAARILRKKYSSSR